MVQRDLYSKVSENVAVKNKFRWDWLDQKVGDVRVGDVIRKIESDGFVKCSCCSGKMVNYGSGGFNAIKKHMLTEKHRTSYASVDGGTTFAGTVRTFSFLSSSCLVNVRGSVI